MTFCVKETIESNRCGNFVSTSELNAIPSELSVRLSELSSKSLDIRETTQMLVLFAFICRCPAFAVLSRIGRLELLINGLGFGDVLGRFGLGVGVKSRL